MDVTLSCTTNNLVRIRNGRQVEDGNHRFRGAVVLLAAIQCLVVRQAKILRSLFVFLSGILLCQKAMPPGLTSAEAQKGSSPVSFSA
jgi:hypothetical protein